ERPSSPARRARGAANSKKPACPLDQVQRRVRRMAGEHTTDEHPGLEADRGAPYLATRRDHTNISVAATRTAVWLVSVSMVPSRGISKFAAASALARTISL